MSGLFDQVVNYSPPLLTAGQVNYDGTWNASTNTPTLVSPPDALSKGDYYVVSAAGTQFSISFAVGDWIISNGTAWEKVDLTDAVSSVFGRTGAVVGDSTDYSAVGITNTAIGAANPSTGAFTSLSSSSTTTLNNTTIPASKTLVVTTDKLSALAATTSAELAGVISDETGSGSLVFATSPTLVTPALGTPSALVGTNITGTASGLTAGNVTTNANLTGAITSTGNATLLGSFSSANLASALTDETGSGANVFATSPTLVTPILGTPQSGTLTSCTGLPISTGVSGLGTGIATALAVNVGSAGAPVVNGGALGTPSSGTVTNLTGTASININGTVGATTASTGAFTTLSATGTVTGTSVGTAASFGPGGIVGTGTGNTLILNGADAANYGALTLYQKNGTVKNYIGHESVIIGTGNVSDNLMLYGIVGTSIKHHIAGTGTITTTTSTGLAVTGALSATGVLSIGSSPGTGRVFNLGNGINSDAIIRTSAATSATGSMTLYFGNANRDDEGWISYVNGTRTLSLRAGDTTVANITSTGLAVTGTASVSSNFSGPNGGYSLGVAGDSYITAFQVFGSGAGGDANKLKLVANGSTIGTVSSTGLAVTGNTKSTFPGSTGGSPGYGFWAQDSTDVSGAGFAAFAKASGTVIGSITRVTTTDAVVYNTTSDGRLKENLRDFTDSGRLIDGLKPRVFDWKNSDENGKNVVGFVAQEQHAADPIFAHIGAVSVGDEDPETITKQWQRSDAALIPILVAELQSVRQRLAALESK